MQLPNWLNGGMGILLVFSLTGCGSRGAAPRQAVSAPTSVGQPADPSFIGRVWLDTTPGSPRGSVMIFLEDRTLVQDSCFETYRLSKWGAEGHLIRWQEESLPVEAEIELPGPEELILKVRGLQRERSFVAADVPYVCPPMPK